MDLVLVLAAGAAAGALVNWANYRLAWNARQIGPWTKPADQAPPRGVFDRLPILGWFGLARESRLHGQRYWVRPLLVEVATAAAMAWLYIRCVREMGFAGPAWNAMPPLWPLDLAPLQQVAWAQFLAQTALLILLLAASLIDLDEKTIPDEITVVGAVVGLIAAWAYPWMLPVATIVQPAIGGPLAQWQASWLHPTAPAAPPTWFLGAQNPAGLAVALACFWGWCFAIAPRTWRPSRGLGKAVRFLLARLWRTKLIVVLAAVGGAAIVAAWVVGGAHWRGLLTSLVGLAGGGAIIWSIRLVGKVSLGREAMGFGDVTLMAMIGAFLGWQPCLVVLFISPFAALVLGVAVWLLRRDREIPYGPFLALATAYLIIRWPSLWPRLENVFQLGPIIPALFAGCLVVMGVMLAGMRLLRGDE